MKTSYYDTFTIDDLKLECYLKEHQPVISDGKRDFFSLEAFFSIYSYKKGMDLAGYAKSINFFLRGIEFHYIEDIPFFKKAYQERIAEERENMELESYRLVDYGIFDLSVMHTPEIDAGVLSFFVYHDITGLPYQVRLPFPIQEKKEEAAYVLLPYEKY